MQTNWFKDAIIYQIYPRSFADSNNDGIGDLHGIISKLDYLKDLGVNTIWLSPVYASPMEDNGYDISDYYAINKEFGTMEDLDELITRSHDRGIRVLMDMVLNHTSSQHEWFKESKKSVDNPYHNYYFWRKDKNNWTGFFGEGAWEKDITNDEYYLHLFAKGQPDLNWDNPEVRKQMKNILKFYLDKGVDGFRLDVINLISKDTSFKNGHELLILKGRKSYINGPHLHEYLKEIYHDVYSHYDCMTVGETCFTTLEDIKKLTDENEHELSMCFNFDHTNVDNYLGVKWLMRKFSLKRWKKIIDKYQYGLANTGWNTLFYENHDQRRSVGRFNTDNGVLREVSAKMLATSMYFLKGTPFIYQGQELGMTNPPIKGIDDIVDVESHNVYALMKKLPLSESYRLESLKNGTRDNARTPMQWDDSKYGGFSSYQPWIKVNPNKDFINVKKENEDPDSVLNYYKKLIKIRKEEELVKEGRYKDLLPEDKNIFAYSRKKGNEELLIICSYSSKEINNPLNINGYTVLLNNYKNIKNNKLLPYQAIVLKKQ